MFMAPRSRYDREKHAVFHDGPVPEKAKRVLSAGKVMATVSDAHGGVLMTLYYDGILEQSEQNITSTVRQDEEIFHIFGGSC